MWVYNMKMTSSHVMGPCHFPNIFYKINHFVGLISAYKNACQFPLEGF